MLRIFCPIPAQRNFLHYNVFSLFSTLEIGRKYEWMCSKQPVISSLKYLTAEPHLWPTCPRHSSIGHYFMFWFLKTKQYHKNLHGVYLMLLEGPHSNEKSVQLLHAKQGNISSQWRYERWNTAIIYEGSALEWVVSFMSKANISQVPAKGCWFFWGMLQK